MVAAQAVELRACLQAGPRSLAELSREHPDGWGVALFEPRGRAWEVHRGVERALDCVRFRALAAATRASVLIGHIRQKTVGPTSLENTHPFACAQGRWVFAHNGTVTDVAYLRAHTAPERADEVRGDTDSERLFAFLLTRLDEVGLTGAPASAATDRLVAETCAELRARPGMGAFNFLLSDGESTYAHRFGRSMFLLERPNGEAIVASEQLTSEPWALVEEGALIRMDRAPETKIEHAPRHLRRVA
ncbi:MAG: class II glutamine amidotransferase [Myxococcales bacterium]|nr:class II glutamine amidotransferase [Myxococcales bacterium]MBL0194401.1 class II glutamine amidotransferase [Myxococcales bacterium]